MNLLRQGPSQFRNLGICIEATISSINGRENCLQSIILFLSDGVVFVVVAAIMMDRYVPPLVSTWPCIDVKPVDGEELASLQVEFEAATAAHRDKYRSFGIKLVSAHRVVNFQLQEAFDARRAVLRSNAAAPSRRKRRSSIILRFKNWETSDYWL